MDVIIEIIIMNLAMAIKIITEKTNLEVRNLKWIKFGKNTILFQTLLKKIFYLQNLDYTYIDSRIQSYWWDR